MNRNAITAIVMAAALLPLSFYGQHVANPGKPVDIPILLSGNFGELRSNHFHSGIDIKTQGRTGLPIYSVDDGYVSRIVVSPTGFGRAVYVTHPATGLTSVYGHLEAFAPKIDKPVRDEQYRRETFSIDMTFKPDEIPVAKGERIALSGNAGSSGGPHLHMDFRDTKTEETLDPMPYFRSHIADKVAPEVRAISLYPEKGKGMVNNATDPETRIPASSSNPFIAWGKVIPGIKAYDKMTGTANIYGVKYLTLTVDGDTIYHRVIDRYDFKNTRAVNTLVDYSGVVRNGSWMMWSRVPQANPLGSMIEAKDNGIIDIDEERDYVCEWILRDEHGNTTRRPFTIRGKRTEITAEDPVGDLLYFDGHNRISKGTITVSFPPNTLYEDTYISVSESAPAANFQEYTSPIYTIGSPYIPISGEIRIEIPLEHVKAGPEDKLTLVRINGNKRSRVDTQIENGTLVATPSSLGKFAVTRDNTAPKITPITPSKWGARGKLTLSIGDNLSGIASYRGEIDGKYALFELDAKTGRVTFVMDPTRFKKGTLHNLVFTATDHCGNSASYKTKFNW